MKLAGQMLQLSKREWKFIGKKAGWGETIHPSKDDGIFGKTQLTEEQIKEPAVLSESLKYWVVEIKGNRDRYDDVPTCLLQYPEIHDAFEMAHAIPVA